MTFPPELGHRIVAVSANPVRGEVCVLVGRVDGYSCERHGGGAVRIVTVDRGDGSVVPLDTATYALVDLDEQYGYPEALMSEAAYAVRCAISELAAALLPPKAGASVEPVTSPAYETRKIAAMADEEPV